MIENHMLDTDNSLLLNYGFICISLAMEQLSQLEWFQYSQQPLIEVTMDGPYFFQICMPLFWSTIWYFFLKSLYSSKNFSFLERICVNIQDIHYLQEICSILVMSPFHIQKRFFWMFLQDFVKQAA